MTTDQAQRGDRPRPDQFRTWIDLRTRNRDTDQFGHVNHAAMATLFEEARIALVFAPEILNETALIDLLVVKLTMVFHQELGAPGAVWIGSTVTRIGTTSFEVNQAIFRDQICFASAHAVCVLIDKLARKPTPVPDTVRRHLGMDIVNPNCPAGKGGSGVCD